MNKYFHIAYIVLFCIVISYPPLAMLLQSIGLKDSLEVSVLAKEKRELTKWPTSELLRRDFTEYTSQVNAYLEDHSSFREELLRFAVHSRFELLGLESDRLVLIGRDGWLYLRASLRNAIGTMHVPDEQLVQWADNALIIKQRVEKNGGVFFIMVPPDKVQVYPEYMNQQLGYVADGRVINRLMPLLNSRGISTIDLLEELVRYKKESPQPLLYSKTDSHWTHKGALRGYQKTIQVIIDNGVDVPSASEEQVKRRVNENFSGGLARILGLSEKFSEPLELLLANQSHKVFSPDKTLLTYGDSFSGGSVHFWPYSFAKYECFHHNISRPNLELIDQTKADVVIFQIIERYLEHPLLLDGKGTRRCT